MPAAEDLRIKLGRSADVEGLIKQVGHLKMGFRLVIDPDVLPCCHSQALRSGTLDVKAPSCPVSHAQRCPFCCNTWPCSCFAI